MPAGPARALVVGASVRGTSGSCVGRERHGRGGRPASSDRSLALPGPPAPTPLFRARPAGRRGRPGPGHQRRRCQIPTSPRDQAAAPRSQHRGGDPMSEDRMAVEIRDAFDSTFVASPGLEDRVVSAIPWERPREAGTSMPRLAGAAAATIAVLAVGILLAPTLLSRLNLQFPGTNTAEPPAYSLAAVSGDSVF